MFNAHPSEPTVGGRLLGTLTGVVLLALLVPGAVLVLLGLAYSAQVPDARIPDGDPCCPHPDSWLAMLGGTAFGIALLIFSGALLGAAAAFIFWGLTGRRLGRRRAVWTALVATPLLYGLLVLLALTT